MIVLDTSTWIWWASDPEQLSRRARAAIEHHAESGLIVSTISVWEVTLKHAIGKLELDRDVRSWIRLATSDPDIRVVPLTIEDAFESALLPGDLHRDPADRFLIATARRLKIAIVTPDNRIRSYGGVASIW